MSPSGSQYEIGHGDYRAIITESGAALRVLRFAGRDLVDGFSDDEVSYGCRGQVLMPWPNRIRDGQYSWRGSAHQLALSEPSRRTALHGLVRWAAWTVVEQSSDSITLGCRVMAQSGYPWTLDLNIRYELGPGGLIVTQGVLNRSPEPAPYAQGAHPYLTAGPGPIDTWELTLPAAARLLRDDERLLPTHRESTVGTPADFQQRRAMGSVSFDHAFTDLARDATGLATVEVNHPTTGHGVALWVDTSHKWLMVYTADDRSPDLARRSLAVEPMTAPPDAFRSGEDIITLAPEGDPASRFEARWGIAAR